jgi:predicted permease
MIKNYLKIAFRNFWRNKTFSTINVLGLSIGISAALVIFLIVYYEFSFDKFEKDSDSIYRVVVEGKNGGEINYSAAVPAPLGSAAETEMTGLEQTVPLFQFQGDATTTVSVIRDNPDKPVVYKKQPNIIFTNRQYFEILPYEWLAGSPVTALQDPFAVVLTERRAQQYFPGVPAGDVVGRYIIYGDSLKTMVTGVVKDLNEHTFFTAGEFISLATVMHTALKDNFMMDVWNDWMAYSQLFVKLSKNNTVERAEVNMNSLLHKYNKEANKNPSHTMAFRLQPLSDVHFNYGSVGQRTAHKPTLYGLLAVAAFLLLLGCINFINLTTAQSAERAKEIGIRKTMGGSRKHLIFQFLGETFFVTLAATVVSVILTPFLLRVFADFIPEEVHFDLLHQPYVVLFLLLLGVLVSILSGCYPALVLSGFKPVSVLKNQRVGSNQTRRAWVRKTLTVSQFVIAQVFVMATVLVSKQIRFAINKDLGFKKDAIVNFAVPRDTSMNNRYALLRKISAIPQVEKASIGFLPPASDGPAFTNIKYNNAKEDIKADVQIRWGDTNYLELYHIKLLAGRNVQQSDTIKEFIINEKYARLLGFQHPEDALNKQLDFNGKKMPVVGVMQDFHEQSLHAAIDPVVFAAFNERSGFFHIALKKQNAGGTVWQAALSKMEKAFKEVYPQSDFSYSFFDESIAKFYKSEENTARLLKWATGLAIFISCLGLLGLAIYTTNMRTKEIGIRKILGASVANIISILSKDFVRLVLIAFAIAAPIAWWTIYNWLQDFVYRTTISWWVFVLSGISMLLIALITLSIQVIKTAVANPVAALRSE